MRAARSPVVLTLAVLGGASCGDSEPLVRDELLRNATYLSQFSDDPVQLAGGQYEAPAAEGSATRLRVSFHGFAEGDLDGDGAEDAAVILVEDPGGSGTFWYLHAMVNEDTTLRDVSWRLLGDRVEVTSVRVDTAVIAVDLLVRRPEEPAVAPPTVPLTRHFVLTDRGLRPLDIGPPTARAAGAESTEGTGLAGRAWTLTAIELPDERVTPVMTGQGDPTLRFVAEMSGDGIVSGRFVGTTGCNRILGSFEAGPGDELSFGPIASTRMVCPEHVMDVESLYRESLQAAESYSAAGGDLTIEFPGGRLTFVDVEAESSTP